MIKFELINPSDKIFFDAINLEVATLATVFVGRGKYSAKSDNLEVPFFMFGGFEEFCKEKFGKILELKDHKQDLIDCLGTFRCEDRQTSLNNICGYAKKLADNLNK